MKTKTLSISINCLPEKLYKFVSNIENFPKWAKFCSSIKKSKGEWIMKTQQGQMKIRIAAKNNFGVLDHYVVDNLELGCARTLRAEPRSPPVNCA